MNVKINKISLSQIEIEIEVPAQEAENCFQLAASNLSKDMKVDGFRPGKVPYDIVEKHKGSEALYNEAANLAIQRTLPRAILDLPTGEAGNNLEIIGRPEIAVTQIVKGSPVKYKAKFWVIPEVELGQYKGLKAKKKELQVKEEEVNNALNYLQKSRAKLITVDRSVKLGDRIEMDFVAQLDGEKIEGGESKNHPMILGEGRFVPGFEHEIEGMKTGEEKNFSLKVPSDWPQKNLADKNLDFSVKMNLIQEREMPELTNEFAKNLGDFESLDKLKESVKIGLVQEKELAEKERIRMELIEKVADSSKMDIPKVLIEVELEKMVDEFKENIKSMGLDFDNYLKQTKKTIEGLKKDLNGQAEKRVKIGLVLKAIAKKENIEVGDEEVALQVDEMLKRYPDIKEAEKNIDLMALKEYTKNIIKNEKVFALLEREAKII